MKTPGKRAIVPGALLLALTVLCCTAIPVLGDLGVTIGRGLTLPLVLLAFAMWRLKKVRHREFAAGPTGLALVYVAVIATGGLASSPAYPLVFLWLAAVAGLLSPRASIFTGVLAVAVEVCVYLTGDLPLATLVAHMGFMTVFASLFAALLVTEVRSIRRTRDEAITEALDRVERDARDFRLIGSILGAETHTRAPKEITRVRQVGSVRAIREALLDVLEVAQRSVSADAAMLFLLDDTGTKLKMKECVAVQGERSIVERPIPSTEGALGAVIKTRRPVNLKPRSGGRGLGYKTRSPVGSFLGVPVESAGHILGVLAVDRAQPDDFTPKDEEILQAVAREAQRAIESERIFVSMDRVKYEQERFHDAFSLLNEALTVDVFADRLLEAVSRIRPFGFLAVTLFDEASDVHSIVSVRSEIKGAEALAGNTFRNREGGLVAMALKNGHALPYLPLSQQPDRSKLLLFGKIPTPELRSVKVFPLLERGTGLGALIVGSVESGADLSREEERMLETVSTHAAITLTNARMYKKMEMMATTDGLTGLVNHRRFKELLGEALARATRFERKVSVLMVDADHFKSVNDTYGHPVGDLVLKRIAALLELEARRTDVVARYGGEEFVLVLDETDRQGALSVAERIREKIEEDVVQGDFGRVRVTASLGLCTWPDQASSATELLERADSALYEAKRKGRNRVAVWRGVHCATPDEPAIRLDRAAESDPPQVQA